MPAPVTLPRLSWGDPAASRRALLVHGLGSNGPLMWRYGVALADAGWHADAVDLRGHGTAPRALDYTLAAYARRPRRDHARRRGPWDLVVGHSLGGAAATLAAASDPAWTRRLVLVDPAIALTRSRPRDRAREPGGVVRRPDAGRRARGPPALARARRRAEGAVGAAGQPVGGRADERAEPAVGCARMPRPPWPCPPTSSRPTRRSTASSAASPPRPSSPRTPTITMSIVAGAGHSPHRDKPEATIAQLARGARGPERAQLHRRSRCRARHPPRRRPSSGSRWTSDFCEVCRPEAPRRRRW